jgi:hypothetical protein
MLYFPLVIPGIARYLLNIRRYRIMGNECDGGLATPGRFSYRVPDTSLFLGALRTYLRAREHHGAAALLEQASCAICPSSSLSSNRWQALSTTVTFYVPAERLPKFTGSLRKELWLGAEAVMPKDAGLDVEQVLVAPLLETPPPETGTALNEGMLAGRGPVEHDGLRFRSWAETRIHHALKRRPVLFFPNPAAVLGGSEGEEKKEPDFLVSAGRANGACSR